VVGDSGICERLKLVTQANGGYVTMGYRNYISLLMGADSTLYAISVGRQALLSRHSAIRGSAKKVTGILAVALFHQRDVRGKEEIDVLCLNIRIDRYEDSDCID